MYLNIVMFLKIDVSVSSISPTIDSPVVDWLVNGGPRSMGRFRGQRGVATR
jgi:hypothetical protein